MTKQPKQKSSSDPAPLNFKDYPDVEKLLKLSKDSAQSFKELYQRILQEDNPEMEFTHAHMFAMSALARAANLARGITQAVNEKNPDAAFGMLRMGFETIALVIYVAEKPDYIDVVTGLAELHGDRRRTHSFQKMWPKVGKYLPGLPSAYAQLSDYVHFNQSGVWSSWSLQDSGTVNTHLGPGWKSDSQRHLAAIWLYEFVESIKRAILLMHANILLPWNQSHEPLKDGFGNADTDSVP